jgi:predicted SnoaL-like aldol condensation-catalyzing enzyme
MGTAGIKLVSAAAAKILRPSAKGTLMPAPFRPTGLRLFLILLAMSAAAPVHAQSPTAQVQATRDVTREERNRLTVVNFYNGVFNRHDVAGSAKVLVDNYVQHNPGVPDGKAPFVNYFTSFFKKNPNAHSRIVRSAADGDLVYLHIHSTNGEADRGLAIIDIFRVENDKIVEHWDVIQPVPETAANKNTMF